MYRMNTSLYVKLRLSQIARRSAELSAASSRLTDMASQLNRLRKLTGMGLVVGRNHALNLSENGDYASTKWLRDS
jgi:hypothetical protein